jgi:S-adenosylmethionine synthetase
VYLFTSEVVSPGHPDKCADIIADTIVDRLLIGDPNSRVASEVFVAGKHVIIGGEVTSNTKLTTENNLKHYSPLEIYRSGHNLQVLQDQV